MRKNKAKRAAGVVLAVVSGAALLLCAAALAVGVCVVALTAVAYEHLVVS
jgi:hypothetical protein